ncbi:MAG: RBBP9/YdeN family alpha/beta hydrolase [Candidatus Levyibacteriota bacterium]
MKNALILHGTDASSKDNWFPWLGKELEQQGWQVWAPDLPKANKPNIERYNRFLFSQKEFASINEETVMIGHSSGAVAILGFLQALPAEIRISHAILVAAFRNNLGWESLNELFAVPFDFEKIKQKATKFTLIHSDNDPYIPLEQAAYLKEKLGGELIILKGQNHFSEVMDPKYNQFPFLIELLNKEQQ